MTFFAIVSLWFYTFGICTVGHNRLKQKIVEQCWLLQFQSIVYATDWNWKNSINRLSFEYIELIELFIHITTNVANNATLPTNLYEISDTQPTTWFWEHVQLTHYKPFNVSNNGTCAFGKEIDRSTFRRTYKWNSFRSTSFLFFVRN